MSELGPIYNVMVQHIEQEDGSDLCPHHCTGCGLGFTYCHWSKYTEPLICGECKTAHRFIWSWMNGWQIKAIPEVPEGGGQDER